MLPLVHQKAGLCSRNPAVRRAPARSWSDSLSGNAVSGPALIPQSLSRSTYLVSFIMSSSETETNTPLIVKQKIDTGNPREPPVPGTLDLLLNIARQR